jgi:hypothetical protein
MKSISKQDKARLNEFEGKLTGCHDMLSAAHATLAAAIETYNEAIGHMNGVVEEIQGFGEDIAREIEGYMDGRSEKWHEGERADAYNDWKSAWEGISFPEIDDYPMPELPDLDGYTSVLTELPVEPEE